MRTVTKTYFLFSELSDEAKERAINRYRESNDEIFWQKEIFDSLKAVFDRCGGVNLEDWSLGLSNSFIRIKFRNEETENLSGKRAIAWLENNLFSRLRIPARGKRRKEVAKYGSLYRFGQIPPCPLTGYCADDQFLDSLRNDVKNGADLATAFGGLASEYQKILNNERDFQNSDEYISEHFESNGYEFTEDGVLV